MKIEFRDDNNYLKVVNITEAVAINERTVGVAFREAGTHYRDDRDHYSDYHDIAIFINNCSDMPVGINWAEHVISALASRDAYGFDSVDISMNHTANTDMSILSYAFNIGCVLPNGVPDSVVND